MSFGINDASVAVTNNTKYAMLALIVIVLSVGFASIWFLKKEAEETQEIPTPPSKDASKQKKKGRKAAGNGKKSNAKEATGTKRSESSPKDEEEVEEEDWIDIPINRSPTAEKKSVAFAADIVEPEPSVEMAPTRDKSKKKEKETPEQKKARLERKAAAKAAKELEEAAEKKAFEERLKASEMAAILQAQEDAEREEKRLNSAPNSARSHDGGDWVVHSKNKGESRRVKTFEEILEERMAKQAQNTTGGESMAKAKEKEKEGRGRTNSSNSNSNSNSNSRKSELTESGKSTNSGKGKKGKANKDEGKKEVNKEVGESKADSNKEGKGEKRPRKQRNDKDKKKDVDKGQGQGKGFAEISANLGSGGFDTATRAGVGTNNSNDQVSIGRFDNSQQSTVQSSPPGLSRSGRGGTGQLYVPPISSPSRDNKIVGGGAGGGGGAALWRSSNAGLPELPPLPLPLPPVSDANSVFVPNAGSGGARGILQRPDSKEVTPRSEEDTKKPQVMNLADLERSLFSIAK